MLRGPIAQPFGILGLMLLAPTAWSLSTGALTPFEAATRGVITLIAVIVLHHLANRGLVKAVETVARRRHAEMVAEDEAQAADAEAAA